MPNRQTNGLFAQPRSNVIDWLALSKAEEYIWYILNKQYSDINTTRTQNMFIYFFLLIFLRLSYIRCTDVCTSHRLTHICTVVHWVIWRWTEFFIYWDYLFIRKSKMRWKILKRRFWSSNFKYYLEESKTP